MSFSVYKSTVLIGYQKAGVSGPRGQLISAYLGNPKYPGEWTQIRINEGEGLFLHGRTKKKLLWWLSEQWLAEGDLVRISTKVAETGVGQDEDRTMELTFSMDTSNSLIEVRWPGLGYKDFPLLKGRLREISRTSLGLERELRAHAVLDEAFDEVRTVDGSLG